MWRVLGTARGWKMLMTDSWLPGSYITYAALTLGNVILFFLRGQSGRRRGVVHPPTRTNSCTDRKAFNNISKQCTCMRVVDFMLGACSLKSPWDVQFGLHLCSTPALLASLFDKLASNWIDAHLSANLVAIGQPQDLADHHVKPSHSTPKFFSSSSSLPFFSLCCPTVQLCVLQTPLTPSSVHLDLSRLVTTRSPSSARLACFFLIPPAYFFFPSLISGTSKYTPSPKQCCFFSLLPDLLFPSFHLHSHPPLPPL